MANGNQNSPSTLEDVLAIRNDDHHYLDRLGILSSWAEQYLTNPMIKDYTDHGVEHSRRVVRYINDLTQEFMQGSERLCDKEIYILLAACYLHDLGMHYQYLENLPSPYFEELKSKYSDVDFSKQGDWCCKQKQRILEVTREEHHRIAYELIMAGSISGDLVEPIDGLDTELKRCVATVCYGHRSGQEEYDKMEDLPSVSDLIRMELLARLLRIGDSLDVTGKRVNMQKMAFQYIDDRSKVHWYKHHYTTGLLVNDHNRVSLSFNLPCTEDDQNRPLYDNIPEWVIDELKIEEYLHVDYLEKHGILIRIDERRNVTYRDVTKLGSDTSRQPKSLLKSSIPVEPMDGELLKLVQSAYEDFRGKNVDSMLVLRG